MNGFILFDIKMEDFYSIKWHIFWHIKEKVESNYIIILFYISAYKDIFWVQQYQMSLQTTYMLFRIFFNFNQAIYLILLLADIHSSRM